MYTLSVVFDVHSCLKLYLKSCTLFSAKF